VGTSDLAYVLFEGVFQGRVLAEIQNATAVAVISDFEWLSAVLALGWRKVITYEMSVRLLAASAKIPKGCTEAHHQD
jgi:hypothetical protein